MDHLQKRFIVFSIIFFHSLTSYGLPNPESVGKYFKIENSIISALPQSNPKEKKEFVIKLGSLSNLNTKQKGEYKKLRMKQELTLKSKVDPDNPNRFIAKLSSYIIDFKYSFPSRTEIKTNEIKNAQVHHTFDLSPLISDLNFSLNVKNNRLVDIDGLEEYYKVLKTKITQKENQQAVFNFFNKKRLIELLYPQVHRALTVEKTYSNKELGNSWVEKITNNGMDFNANNKFKGWFVEKGKQKALVLTLIPEVKIRKEIQNNSVEHSIKGKGYTVFSKDEMTWTTVMHLKTSQVSSQDVSLFGTVELVTELSN